MKIHSITEHGDDTSLWMRRIADVLGGADQWTAVDLLRAIGIDPYMDGPRHPDRQAFLRLQSIMASLGWIKCLVAPRDGGSRVRGYKKPRY